MKKGLIAGALITIFLLLIQFTQSPERQDDACYKHYREEFAHNLKDPLMEHYRKLSIEAPEEALKMEKEPKETK